MEPGGVALQSGSFAMLEVKTMAQTSQGVPFILIPARSMARGKCRRVNPSGA
jgi:hypothetical protein